MNPTHPEHTAFLLRLAAANAPRLFAIGLEYDDDCHIAAYGMAFPDRTDVTTSDGTYRLQVARPEDVRRHFQDDDGEVRLVWLSEPTAGTADEGMRVR
ncbi:hypothetical protein [Saccharothrix obliqua]|uniref:hypothetical protein n=1 Tax=Saccharothrix obliqua TaxID=2861747 RepID=UPI001C5E545C|nr:hypothetical protein [Saccharothrix obliqua]MBW4720721.1 hypothetical protein [Saccharothrix obliqua]